MRSSREKLSNADIELLLYMMQRAGLSGRMTLPPQRRARVVPLWRRQLIEVWYRCAPNEGCMHGPYFKLTVEGHRLGCAFLAAREVRHQTARRQPPIAA
jgi:hypothetical protein